MPDDLNEDQTPDEDERSPDDLTSVERTALELLRTNAPEAPEALASLNHASRGRVLGALSNPDAAPQSTRQSYVC